MRYYNYYRPNAIMPRRFFYNDASGTEQENTRIPKAYYEYDEDKDNINLTVELPGVNKDSIKISSTDRTLSLNNEVSEEDKMTPKYSRSFKFHYKIKPETIKASYADGILKLTIERDVPQKFDVEIN